MILYSSPREYKHTSRYGKYRQLVDNLDSYVETFNQSIIRPSEQDIYHTVLREQENRLDIIANIYYGDPSFFWVIALANELVDPFVVTTGSILRIPAITSLYTLGGVLRRE
jgi:hypothetical protein